jgi:hypothetical protein
MGAEIVLLEVGVGSPPSHPRQAKTVGTIPAKAIVKRTGEYILNNQFSRNFDQELSA